MHYSSSLAACLHGENEALRRPTKGFSPNGTRTAIVTESGRSRFESFTPLFKTHEPSLE